MKRDLLTYAFRWKGRTPQEERPRLHDDVGRWTRHCTPLTFWIIEGGGDSLLAPLRAEESPEAARCLPRRAAYGGRRRQGLRLRRSVSRQISFRGVTPTAASPAEGAFIAALWTRRSSGPLDWLRLIPKPSLPPPHQGKVLWTRRSSGPLDASPNS